MQTVLIRLQNQLTIALNATRSKGNAVNGRVCDLRGLEELSICLDNSLKVMLTKKGLGTLLDTQPL